MGLILMYAWLITGTVIVGVIQYKGLNEYVNDDEDFKKHFKMVHVSIVFPLQMLVSNIALRILFNVLTS